MMNYLEGQFQILKALGALEATNLIDLGAIMNVIITRFWEMLGKPTLTTVQSHFIGFNNSVTKCQGTFLAKVCFGNMCY